MEKEFNKEGVFTTGMLSFIFDNIENEKVYTHYTHSEIIANKIMEEGFKYIDSFYKTTQNVHNDLVVLNYKHNLYEHYGEFIIIICIPDELIDFVKKEVNLSKLNLTVEDFISKDTQQSDENYTLPAVFVKGYIKYRTGEIFRNPEFLRNYSLSGFKEQHYLSGS